MALYGIVADIHGNLQALESALQKLDARDIGRLLCLGDIVGYNADAERCASLMRERDALAIAGNHDLIALGRLGFGRCSNKAKYSLRRTRQRLDGATARYLAQLPPHRVIEDRIVLIHGGVRDVEQYMVGARHIAENAAYARSDFPRGSLFLFGHTHEPKVYELHGEDMRELAAEGDVALRADRVYFVNPGSIDASRKRTRKMAEFALLDSSAWRISFLRVPYDDTATEVRAAREGYRIGPWTDRAWSIKRRLAEWCGSARARASSIMGSSQG